MTSIADMIKDIQNGEAAGTENKFNELMADRMAAAIETKYDRMFGSHGEPEVEAQAEEEPVEAEAPEQDLEPETEE